MAKRRAPAYRGLVCSDDIDQKRRQNDPAFSMQHKLSKSLLIPFTEDTNLVVIRQVGFSISHILTHILS